MYIEIVCVVCVYCMYCPSWHLLMYLSVSVCILVYLCVLLSVYACVFLSVYMLAGFPVLNTCVLWQFIVVVLLNYGFKDCCCH